MHILKIQLEQVDRDGIPTWYLKRLAEKLEEFARKNLDWNILGVIRVTVEHDINSWNYSFINLELQRYTMKPTDRLYLDNFKASITNFISELLSDANLWRTIARLLGVHFEFLEDSWDRYMDELDTKNEEERPFYEGDGIKKVMNEKYVCHVCKVRNVKLWRVYQSSYPGLYCVDCAEKDQNKKYKDPEAPHWEQGDTIGWLCPAVPTSDNTYWGYTSIPQVGCKWWYDLPLGREI